MPTNGGEYITERRMCLGIPGGLLNRDVAIRMEGESQEYYHTVQPQQAGRAAFNRQVRPLTLCFDPQMSATLFVGDFNGPARDRVFHDLRSPLTIIIGYANTVADYVDTLSKEELHQSARAILQVGLKMDNIIDELMLLAGLRKAIATMGPLDMAGIVAEAQQRLARVIELNHAEIVLPATWPETSGYGPWVEGVWTNYISNAIKYGGRPPRVELGATPRPDGAVRFWVRDNGPGLTPEAQARLFTPFERLDQVRIGGHGVGLSIVRRIVEKMGGQVSVESDGEPGQGCTFSFTLPVAQSER